MEESTTALIALDLYCASWRALLHPSVFVFWFRQSIAASPRVAVASSIPVSGRLLLVQRALSMTYDSRCGHCLSQATCDLVIYWSTGMYVFCTVHCPSYLSVL
jgi:hypothetical protein